MIYRKFLSILAAGCMAPWALVADEVPEGMLERLSTLVPDVTPDKVSESPIPGLYEVSFGPTIVYVSKDGRYMVQGDVVDLEKRENLTEKTRNVARASAIGSLVEDEMVVFAPKDVKHTITVFTDVDCGYCQRMHQEVPQLTDMGVKVRYLAFPRAGVDSKSGKKIQSVWCADDRNKAMDDAKLNGKFSPKECANPVADHYAMGRLVGVSGTPTIVLESGEVLPGYVPAKRLVRQLEGKDGD